MCVCLRIGRRKRLTHQTHCDTHRLYKNRMSIGNIPWNMNCSHHVVWNCLTLNGNYGCKNSILPSTNTNFGWKKNTDYGKWAIELQILGKLQLARKWTGQTLQSIALKKKIPMQQKAISKKRQHILKRDLVSTISQLEVE